MTRFDQVLAHGAKIALFILGSVVAYGLYAFLAHNPQALGELKVIIPVGMINVGFAMLAKFFNLPSDDFPPLSKRR